MDIHSLITHSSSSGIQCPSKDGTACCGVITYDSMKDNGVNASVVEDLIAKAGVASGYLKEDVLNAVSIKCPRATCAVLLDLNPDACAAISCSNCGQHFCLCCHARFASSQQAHLHIPLAHNWRDVFLPRDMILEGQQRLRLTQLQDALEPLQCDEIRQDFIDTIAADLTELGLPVDWNEIVVRADAARTILNRERLGEPAVGDDGFRDEGDMNLDVEERIEETAEQVRGNTLLALCFERRFDQVRIAVSEFQHNNWEWTVDWYQRGLDGNNAFNVAARLSNSFHSIACMQVLIDLGAGVTINEVDCDGFTALQRCVMLNDIQCVKFLLEQEGIDLEAQTQEGRTALYLSAEMRHLHISRELLRRGAYVHTSDHAGSTVLMVVGMRLQHEDADTVTSGEIVRNLQFWLSQGADIEVPDGQAAWRALHYAAAGRYDAGDVAVRTLLRAGAQVTAKTRFDMTPLMVAACFGNIAAIKVLVEAEGSRPSIPFDSTAPLLLNDAVESRREEITSALKKAQSWQRFKANTLASCRNIWTSYSLYIMCGVGVGVAAIAFIPLRSYFSAQRIA